MSKSLIAFDTNRIKEYVFATDTLKEIRGASNILDVLNSIDMREIMQEYDSTCYYAHSGSGLFVLPTINAQDAIERVCQAYSHSTHGGATMTGIELLLPDTFNVSEDNIQDLWKLLGYKLAAKKSRNPISYTSVTHPLLRFGHSDGTFYANHLDEENQPISSVSSLKRERNIQLRNKANREGKPLPEDFDSIANASSLQGYFALIYADGDSLGRVLEQCPKLQDIQDIATGIYDILSKAIGEATKDIDSSHYDILLRGGDDLLLAVPAHKALEVGLIIAEYFKSETKAHLGQEYTLSTAIVWAHKNFPLGTWLDIAESVLKFAKDQAAKHGTRGLINFLVISSANHLDFSQFYKQILITKSHHQHIIRTMRPYTSESLRELIKYRQNLKNVSRSRLEALRQAVFQISWQQASLDALRVLVHWRGDELRQKIHSMPIELRLQNDGRSTSLIFPFIQSEDSSSDPDDRIRTYSTPIADLVELWDFIPGGTDEE